MENGNIKMPDRYGSGVFSAIYLLCGARTAKGRSWGCRGFQPTLFT